MVDLGQRRDRALAPAAAHALLDRDGRRDAEDRVHVGARRGLDELPRVGVQRLEIAALALREHDVEGERGLAAPETPVTTVKRLRGIATSMFLRLCSRALWIWIA